MSISGIDLRTREFDVVPIYTCNVCDKQERGTTAKISVPNASWSILSEELRQGAYRISNSSMPFDWAGYGNGIHKCPSCK